ncbi:hypothetical protein TNIN_100101 [Trichonephila inaurata madagascariensis]|uniref:Uncharacterized protein n=1 Tax=Trichonephila inaurata madagascariensis TaxID=2747483 RepID=A0A8X7CUT9_9ARAC|nr:hypothetical protein TNIN_100101 [Trichonephila inaurata madagascariensis]
MILNGDTFAGGDKMTRDIRVDRCITEKKAFYRLSGREAHQMPSFRVLEPAANSSNRSNAPKKKSGEMLKKVINNSPSPCILGFCLQKKNNILNGAVIEYWHIASSYRRDHVIVLHHSVDSQTY